MERREQSKGFREWDEFEAAYEKLKPLVKAVILRGTYDSGIRRNKKLKKDDPEIGAATTHYNDPTGETAIKDEVADAVEGYIVAMVEHIRLARNNAMEVLDITPASAIERAKRSVPDCRACGKPVVGQIVSGYDKSCHQAWRRAGYPDRVKFEQERRERVENVDTK